MVVTKQKKGPKNPFPIVEKPNYPSLASKRYPLIIFTFQFSIVLFPSLLISVTAIVSLASSLLESKLW